VAADERPRATESRIGDRLIEARNGKGVDIRRAERDTRIRSRYLLALEHGDTKSLPGGAYTSGFLRTYAEYLGLDVEAVVSQWQREHRDTRGPRRIAVPRPLRTPRGAITLSPAMLRSAVFGLVVAGFAVYIGVQFLRVAKPPPLELAQPAVAVSTVAAGTTSYTLRGSTSPGAVVSVAAPGRQQPYRVTAGDDGSWAAVVELRRGANLFDVDARDPATGKSAVRTAQLHITVPFGTTSSPTLRLDQPFAGGIFDRASVAVQGVARNAHRVAVTATSLNAGGPEIQDAAVDVGADDFFTTSLALAAGPWHLEVSAVAADGRVVTVERDIAVVTRLPAR
jgi:cytoskeletal protein RodZ